VHAKIKFRNRGTFFIEPTDSKVTLNNTDYVFGRSELSIVKSDDYKRADNWGEQYSEGVDISQEGSQAPATMLVYSNSNAMADLAQKFDQLAAHDELSVRSNSNALVYLDTHVTVFDNDVAVYGKDVNVYYTHQAYAENTTKENLVYFKNGFTVDAGKTLTLNTPILVTGNINLSDTGTINLANDLYFGSNAYLTRGGIVDGNGFALVLSCTFAIPENQKLHITGDTIINGHGTTFYLEPHARIIVDNNVTLTLKNVRLKSARNNVTNPIIHPLGPRARVTLLNAELALGSDFTFTNGQLFIHDDVLISGTHTFSYCSSQSSYICDGGMFYFENDSTFFYNPPITANHLIQMQSDTSTIFLDGATLQTTHTGIRLSKGTLCLENKVFLNSDALSESGNQSFYTGIIFGDSSLIDGSGDLDVHVLGAAYVEVNGVIVDDSV